MYTKQYVATFVQGASGERLELLEAVEYVDVLVLRFGRHVAQLDEVAVADAEREDVDGVTAAQAAGDRAGVAAVRVAVGDEEHRLARVRASRPQHFLRYDTMRYEMLLLSTCARKPTRVGLIYRRTETTTTNCKQKNQKGNTDMLEVTAKVWGIM